MLEAWQAELMACIQSAKAVHTLGIQKIVLETDALMVKQALQSSDFRLSAMGGLVHELKEHLVDEFTEARVVYTPHDCNKIAHELAKSGSLAQDELLFGPGNLPDCIRVMVASDFSGSHG